MDIILTIYLVGLILFCIYFSYIAFAEWDIICADDKEPEMKIAIAISILLIGLAWPITIPYAIFSKQIDKDN